MTDEDAEIAFRKFRWQDTAGEPVCPTCGGLDAYDCRRPNGAPRFRCKACRKDFSVTNGTLFASYKRPVRAAIAIFVNKVKGKSALALSRDLGLAYKSAFVLAHKMREAMAEEMKGRAVGGDGKVCEIDGGYFGGYIKPSNHVENRRDRSLVKNQNGKRQCVVIVRERDSKSLPAVFRSEGSALSWIKSRAAKGTVVQADEANAWNDLHSRFEMKRVNHEQAYSTDGACTNMAEEYFSRLRRAEIGHHHHIAGTYLLAAILILIRMSVHCIKSVLCQAQLSASSPCSFAIAINLSILIRRHFCWPALRQDTFEGFTRRWPSRSPSGSTIVKSCAFSVANELGTGFPSCRSEPEPSCAI